MNNRMSSILAVFLLANAAQAEPTKGYFAGLISRDSSNALVARKVETMLASEFGQNGIQILSRGDSQNSQATPNLDFDDLSRLLENARGQFFEGQFKLAVTSCDDGIARFEDRFAHREHQEAWKLYAELSLIRVMALRRLDQKPQGDLAMAAIAAQVPDYIPDPNVVPPNLLNRYQAIKSRLLNLPPVALSLQSTPPGANAIVNGKNVGLTPIQLNLVPGPHYVTIEAQGERFEEYIVLREGSRDFSVQLSSHLRGKAHTLREQLQNGLTEEQFAELSNQISGTTFIGLLERRQNRLRVYLAKHSSKGFDALVAMDVDPNLLNFSTEVKELVQTVMTTQEDRLLSKATSPTKPERFVFLGQLPSNARAAADRNQDRLESTEEDSLLFPVMMTGLVLTGVTTGLIAVGAASGAAYYYYVYPSNTGGTDVVIDASEL